MKAVTADAMVWFPMLEAGHRGRFVVTPRKFNADEVVEPIDPCVIRGKKIGFPLTEGVKLAESLGYSVQCAHPETKRVKFVKCPDPSHPSAPPNQAEFFEAVKCAVIENYAACAQAQTGSGKTVTALYVAAKLQTTILAIVPSRSLAQQWLEEAVTHLGLLPSEVGIVQAGVFPPGKKFVAAVIHNVIGEGMPKGYAEQFGLVVADECHRLGAREFSKVLSIFPSQYKLALTATAKRADGCWKLVEDYFGPVCCLAENDSMETHVYPIYSDFPLPGWATELEVASWIKWLTNLSPRNKIITDTAKELYRQGRKLVIMSDSVRHLHTLQKELIARGIPEKEIAFYTGFIYANGYEKLKKPKKISIAPSAHAVIRSSNKLRVVLGTYAQMKEAVNIPWLDAGIDATPKADGIQMVGRIRRRRPGKKIPCWFTIVDRHIPRLFAFAKARMRGLASVGITINDFNYE